MYASSQVTGPTRRSGSRKERWGDTGSTKAEWLPRRCHMAERVREDPCTGPVQDFAFLGGGKGDTATGQFSDRIHCHTFSGNPKGNMYASLIVTWPRFRPGNMYAFNVVTWPRGADAAIEGRSAITLRGKDSAAQGYDRTPGLLPYGSSGTSRLGRGYPAPVSWTTAPLPRTS